MFFIEFRLIQDALHLSIDELRNLSANITCSQRLLDFGHNEDIMPIYILRVSISFQHNKLVQMFCHIYLLTFQTFALAECLVGLMALWVFAEDLVAPMIWEDANPESAPLLPYIERAPSPPNADTTCLSFVYKCCQTLYSKCCNREQTDPHIAEELLPLSQFNTSDTNSHWVCSL